MADVQFVTDREVYDIVIQKEVPRAREFVWIGTSDIKDLHVDKSGRMVPFLEVLAGLIQKQVCVRLIHAKEPGPAFRKDFDRYPVLFDGMERLLCPRVHFKTVIVDGRIAYVGSANLTGAGMGAKTDARRNFEAGFITSNPTLVTEVMDYFDSVWMGGRCPDCRRKEFCSEYPELVR